MKNQIYKYIAAVNQKIYFHELHGIASEYNEFIHKAIRMNVNNKIPPGTYKKYIIGA